MGLLNVAYKQYLILIMSSLLINSLIWNDGLDMEDRVFEMLTEVVPFQTSGFITHYYITEAYHEL